MSTTVVRELAGQFLALRFKAHTILDGIEAEAEPGARVVLDFAGVVAVTNGFIDELVCGLAANRRVIVTGMNAEVAETVALAVQRRGLDAKVTRG